MLKKIKQLKSKWLEFRLQCLIRRQECIDAILAEREIEYNAGLQEMRDAHGQVTNKLAAKRTALRSQLIRL